MRRFGTTNATAIGVAAAAVAIAGTTYAIAAIPGSGGVITGCYSKSTGSLRVVAAAKDCKRTEKVLTWNQKGGQGPRGLRGLRGIMGEKGNSGSDAGGTILAATSGTAVQLSSLGPMAEVGAALPLEGLGDAPVALTTTTVDETSMSPNPAEIFPRVGTLSNLSATLTLTTASNNPFTVIAQLYSAPEGSTTLSPVSGAACSITVPAVNLVGETFDCGNGGLNTAIPSGSTGVVIFSATSTTLGAATLSATAASSLTVGS